MITKNKVLCHVLRFISCRMLITTPGDTNLSMRRYAEFIGRANFMNTIGHSVVAVLRVFAEDSESLNRHLCAY